MTINGYNGGTVDAAVGFNTSSSKAAPTAAAAAAAAAAVAPAQHPSPSAAASDSAADVWGIPLPPPPAASQRAPCTSGGGSGSSSSLECAPNTSPRPGDSEPRLVVFSGGTAFNSVASQVRSLTTRVAHVLPVSDDGGSTAEIVRVLGGPAVGDIRSRCLRLADDSDAEGRAVRQLLAHRLSAHSSAQAKAEWYAIVEGEHPLWEASLGSAAGVGRGGDSVLGRGRRAGQGSASGACFGAWCACHACERRRHCRASLSPTSTPSGPSWCTSTPT